MRVSTYQIFDTGSRNIMRSQSNFFNTQNQLGTGKRILTPTDDPIASAQVLLETQNQSVNQMFAENQKNAGNHLALEEDSLRSVVDSILFTQAQLVSSRNGSYQDKQREAIAMTLQGQLDFMVGIANSADASGHYLFSGYQGETEPFQKVLTNGGVSYEYQGDQGQRQLQVGPSRNIPISDSGNDIFGRIRSGNGTSQSVAPLSNTGTGIISQGSITNPQAWDGGNGPSRYEIEFIDANTYKIRNTSQGVDIVSGATFASDTAITSIPGLNFKISGTPAAGDKFTVEPSQEKSLFVAMQETINALKMPVDNDPIARAQQQNIISANMGFMSNALDNVSASQSRIGARRHELEALTNVSEDLNLTYAAKISRLEDIDYAEAISRFNAQEQQLQASQASFGKITASSLFNYI